MAHDHDGRGHHGHEHGKFGPVRAFLYFFKNPRGVGNRLVLEKADVKATDTVLDIGSGPGTAVIEAVKRHKAEHAIGIEPAGVLRAAASLRAAVRGAGASTKFLEGTAEAVPIPDECTDVVLAVNSMHHWEDVDRGIAEVARILRPGGRFVSSDEDFSAGAHPRGFDPHADWPSVDYDRVIAAFASHGMTAETFTDSADGYPVNAVVAVKP